MIVVSAVAAVTLLAGQSASTSTVQPSQSQTAVASPSSDPGSALGVLTLEDLGFSEELSLEGPSATTAWAFPLPMYGIDGGLLTLAVSLSPSLSDESVVRVLANERPLASATVGALRQNSQWRIPIGAIAEPLVTIRLTSNLYASDDRCADLRNGGLWLTLDPMHSGLSFRALPGLPTIGDFLRFPGGRLLVRTAWSGGEQQAKSIAVVSALARLVRQLPVEVEVEPDPNDGDTSQTLTSRPARLVAVTMDPSAPPVERDGDTLTIRGDRDALSLLESEAGRALQLSGVIKDVQSNRTDLRALEGDGKCGRNRLCFDDLASGDLTVSGIGAMKTSTHFTLARFGGWPEGLQFHLDAGFDHVPANTLERALARIRINGALVDTIDLRGHSAVQRTIDLPPALLNVDNTLEVEFLYAPAPGDCHASLYTFSGQVRRTSTLTWSRLGDMRGRLAEVIASGGPVALQLDGASPELARTAARLLSTFARYTPTPLEFQTTHEGSHAAAKPAAWRFVMGQAVREAAPIRLLLGDSFEIRARRAGVTALKSTPDAPLVAVEYLHQGLPTIVLQATPSAKGSVLEAAFRDVLDTGRVLGLPGNVLVSNGLETQALDLNDHSLDVQLAESGFDWFTDYRWVWFLLTALIIVVLIATIFRYLGRRPPVPLAPVN